jgi:integrase
LRKAKWEEFDLLEEGLWVVPKDRMKVKEEDHKVSLPRQAIKLLLELKKITGQGEHVFPSTRQRTATISDAGPLNAIRRMGYDKETMTIHGFRSTASTCLNELGYPRDHIEKQLAHKDEDEVRAAYNRAEYFDQRKKMLQDWANYLDKLKLEARERRHSLKLQREQRLAMELA